MATRCITVKLLSVVCEYSSISLTTFLLMLVTSTPARRSCGCNLLHGSISTIGATIDCMPTDFALLRPTALLRIGNANGLFTPPRQLRPPQPPPTSCTTSVPTTSPARIEARRDCGWCHAALRTLRRVDMSAPVTICRHHLPAGFWRGPSQRSWPAAQAVMRRTVAGGHRVGVSIGTEHALCPSSLSAL
jgi:hypothetical protein